jgi:hypothetical protein
MSRCTQPTPPTIEPIDRLFNLLEDGRVTALGKAANPHLATGLDAFIDEAVDQCNIRAMGSGRGSNPASKPHQLLYALEVYALTSVAPSPLHAAVAPTLEQLTAKIDASREQPTVGCGMTALELYRDVAQYRPST